MPYTPSNLRQNPLTSAYSWRTITAELHTVAEFDFLPGIYGFVLKDKPNPDTTTITFTTDDTAATVYEIITSGTPNAGQVRYDSARGICIFNVAANALDFVVDYQGGGTNLTYEMLLGIASYGPDVLTLQGEMAAAQYDIVNLQDDVATFQYDVSNLQDDVTTLETFQTNIAIYSKLIGEPFPLFAHLTGVTEPPSSNFIKLTKDLTGGGAYNAGKLTSQATVTSGGVRYYTAQISDAGSPMNGVTIPLINSTEISNTAGTWANLPAVLGAHANPAAVTNGFYANQMQGHWHNIEGQSAPVSHVSTGQVVQNYANTTLLLPVAKTIISDGINGTPRTGTQTRQDTFAAVYYMRYK